MILLLEGIDRTGKTTLSKYLSDYLNIPVINLYNKHDHNTLSGLKDFMTEYKVNDYFEELVTAEMIDQLGIDIILDRSFPSAWVYRTVNYGNDLDENVISWWCKKFIKTESICFYLQPDIEFITNKYSDLDRFHLIDLDRLFECFLNKMKDKGCNLVYNHTTLDGEWRSVKKIGGDIISKLENFNASSSSHNT